MSTRAQLECWKCHIRLYHPPGAPVFRCGGCREIIHVARCGACSTIVVATPGMEKLRCTNSGCNVRLRNPLMPTSSTKASSPNARPVQIAKSLSTTSSKQDPHRNSVKVVIQPPEGHTPARSNEQKLVPPLRRGDSTRLLGHSEHRNDGISADLHSYAVPETSAALVKAFRPYMDALDKIDDRVVSGALALYQTVRKRNMVSQNNAKLESLGKVLSLFTDSEFPHIDASIGKGAEISITFILPNKTKRVVQCPIVWRRPMDIADENGAYYELSTVRPLDEMQKIIQRAKQRESSDASKKRSNSLSYLKLVSKIDQQANFNTPAAISSQKGSEEAHSSADAYVPPPLSDIMFLQERLSELGDPTKIRDYPWVFRRGAFSPYDIVQGQLGTCWFLSALALVAQRQELITRLFAPEPLADAKSVASGEILPMTSNAAGNSVHTDYYEPEDIPLNPLGLYQVRLCINSRWEIITVDDALPVCGYRGKVTYTAGRRRQIWPSIVEKAAAKAVGSFSALSGGTMESALRMLTGAPVFSVYIRTSETREEMMERRTYDLNSLQSGGSNSFGPKQRIQMVREAYERSRKQRDLVVYAPNGRLVTGGFWEYELSTTPPPAVTDRLWSRLVQYHDAGFLIGASCGNSGEAHTPHMELFGYNKVAWTQRVLAQEAKILSCGLFSDHAYSVLSVAQDPRNPSIRLIQIRNPHGKGGLGASDREDEIDNTNNAYGASWRGDWCDSSSLWKSHPELYKKCNPTQEAEGIFWMHAIDFATFFNRLEVAKVRGFNTNTRTRIVPDMQWMTAREKVSLPRRRQQTVRILKLTPLVDTPLDFVLSDLSLAQKNRYAKAQNSATNVLDTVSDANSNANSNIGKKGSFLERQLGTNGINDLDITLVEELTPMDARHGVVTNPLLRNENKNPHAQKHIHDLTLSLSLAEQVTGLKYIAGEERTRLQWSSIELFLRAGTRHDGSPRTYYLACPSFTSYIDKYPDENSLLFELHFPQRSKLKYEMIDVPHHFFARILLSKVITLGTPNDWSDTGSQVVPMGSFDPKKYIHFFMYHDKIGAFVAAVNTHSSMSYRVKYEVKAHQNELLCTRPSQKTEDEILPQSMQLLQTVTSQANAKQPLSWTSDIGFSYGPNRKPEEPYHIPNTTEFTLHHPLPMFCK